MPVKTRHNFVKVRREGGSTVLTVGSLIPAEWKLVEIIEKSCKAPGHKVLEIVKVA